MRALVVGGTGFLGLNLVAAGRDAGWDVAATRRRSSNTIFLRRLGVPMLQATLDDPASLTLAMREREVVFFAAGHYPRYSIDTEAQVDRAVGEARTLLAAARAAGVRRVVYSGSVVTVGRPVGAGPARETDGEATPPTGSTYFAVKLALERTLRDEAAGLEVMLLCPTGFLGPFDHKVGTGFFLVGLATGQLRAWVDGRINMIDVRDAAAAHLRAATAGRPGQRYILSGHNLTAGELLHQIAARFDLPLPERQLTPSEAEALATAEEARCLREGRGRPALSREIVDMIVHGQHVDASLARAELGLTVRPLAETLRDAFHWYRGNGYIPAPRGTEHAQDS